MHFLYVESVNFFPVILGSYGCCGSTGKCKGFPVLLGRAAAGGLTAFHVEECRDIGDNSHMYGSSGSLVAGALSTALAGNLTKKGVFIRDDIRVYGSSGNPDEERCI